MIFELYTGRDPEAGHVPGISSGVPAQIGVSERISDAEKDDLERRKERHARQAARNKENLKARTKRYKDSPN